MKVWLVHLDSYGEVVAYADTVDITQVREVKSELEYLEGGYEDERDEFLSSVDNVIRRGYGTANIEERLTVELVTLKTN